MTEDGNKKRKDGGKLTKEWKREMGISEEVEGWIDEGKKRWRKTEERKAR